MTDRIVIIGADGQVGWELLRAMAPLGEVIAMRRPEIDVVDPDSMRRAIRDVAPRVIVNAAAYTAVDRAESEVRLAEQVNGRAPGVLAAEAARASALLVHYSTDYVFSGTGARPYVETDAPSPATAYGRSKLAGDEAVLASEAEAYILRVAWVYGNRGKNFLQTIRRLAAERDELRIVSDQHGGPTWCRAIADATTQAVGQWLRKRRNGGAAPPRGVYHLAPPDHTTWYGFASAIVDAIEMPTGRPKPVVVPISTSEFPSRAARPTWSVMDSSLFARTFGHRLPPWLDQLHECLEVDP